jgi:hypothetical protein
VAGQPDRAAFREAVGAAHERISRPLSQECRCEPDFCRQGGTDQAISRARTRRIPQKLLAQGGSPKRRWGSILQDLLEP